MLLLYYRSYHHFIGILVRVALEEYSQARIQLHVDLATPISLPREVASGLIVLMTIQVSI